VLQSPEGLDMQRKFQLPVAATSLFALLAPMLLCGAVAAASGEGVTVNITNDGTEDIVVTVYDTTIGPDAVVLPHTRLNGFTTIPVSVSPDASGRANLSWTAVTADAKERKCGHAERLGLGDSSSVMVHADSACAST
jgi:hypothetical protein